MKMQWKRILALVLTISLVASACTLSNTEKAQAETESGKLISSAEPDDSFTASDETIYVFAGADGQVSKIIVSDQFKDEDGNKVISQETLTEALPVDLHITYFLDDEEISPEELAGKSGNVTIRYEYINHQYEMREIDGKQEKIYVPFLMLTALILDNGHFTDVAVKNGKAINDGNRTIVVGYALPGMTESLALPEELDFEIPEVVEITAKAEDFKLGSTFTVAANNLFDDVSEDDPDAIGKLMDSMNEMTDAMGQLLDGTGQLSEGLDTLLEKTDELQDGVDTLASAADQVASGAQKVASGANDLKDGADTLASGAAELKDGADALAAGAGDLLSGANSLASGVDALANGLGQVSKNSSEINAGAEQVFLSLLASAKTQMEAAGLSVPNMTIGNYQTVLNGVIDSLDSDKVYAQALEEVTAAVEAQRGYITEQVTAAVKEQVETQVTAAVRARVSEQVTDAVKEQVSAGVEAQRDYITKQVTAAVRAEVLSGVTAAVEAQVREQVIYAATGMSVEDYNAAVEAGLVSEEVQAQVEAAVAAQMASEAVQATIAAQTDAKMDTEEIKQTIAAQVEKTIEDQIAATMASSDIQNTIALKIEEQMASDQVQGLIAESVAAQMESEEIKATIEENVEAQVQKAIADTMAGDEVQAKLAEAAEGAKSVIALKTSLDQYNAFYLGIMAYTDAVDTAAAGAKELASGSKALKEGIASLSDGADTFAGATETLADGAKIFASGTTTLADGIGSLSDGTAALADGADTLKKNMPALVDGVSQLRDGAKELNEGLNTFNDEAIKKLSDLVNKDVNNITDRLKAVVDLGRNYKAFTDVVTDDESEVKFIYRTDAIEE